MQDPLEFYTRRIAECTERLSVLNSRSFAFGMIRLLVFSLAVFGVYRFYGNTWGLLLSLLLCGGFFLFLVSRHTDLRAERNRFRMLLKLNQTEIAVLNRQFQDLPDGAEFTDPKHHFSQDIDLFGRGSFYQYANRTALRQGSETFASLLTANDISDIPAKQEGVKELAQMPEWRQEYSAIAGLVKTETSHDSIIRWMQAYKTFVPKSFSRISYVFSALSVVIITAYISDLISGWWLAGWFFLGLGMTGRYLKKMNKLSSDTAKILATFDAYQKLMVQIERADFQSGLLKEQRASIAGKDLAASEDLRKFARLLNALDQRNNLIIGILANAFLLRDLFIAMKIEDWIAKHGVSTETWFGTIAFFDAYNSLGNFAFNHQDFCYPKKGREDTLLETNQAAHPLMAPERRVANDFKIDRGEFRIITGANMAGKSTFLRTISLLIVMANTGLPVCAGETRYNPIRLITSMRTTDSLTDDESYFFSELKRLKFIMDEIAGEDYFVVLDEILKGTNSTDKARGSQKFVQQLVRTGSTGMIATHDLSLCEVAGELEAVDNFYFDAEIIEDELHFDYKLKKGICRNMNASFLLKKMKIVE